MNFTFENVYLFKIQIREDYIINIHNVYNFLFILYVFKIVLLVIKTIKSELNENKKHIFLNNFNLHHLI